MRKLWLFGISAFITVFCSGQKNDSINLYNGSLKIQLRDLLSELEASSHQVNSAYDAIKIFRDAVNHDTDNGIKDDQCGNPGSKENYEILLETLLITGDYPAKSFQIIIKKLESGYLNCKYSESMLDSILHETDSSDFIYFLDSIQLLRTKENPGDYYMGEVDLFLKSLKLIDASQNYIENLIYKIEFDTIQSNIKNDYIIELVREYNRELESVGRRMGRLILSAVNEDPDYVTPSSQTRLDLARSDLDRVELFLKDAIYNRIQELSKPEKTPTANLLITNEGRNDYSYFVGASTNLKEALGFSTLLSWHKPGFHFDTGFDVYFRFVHEGDILIQPKVGIPIEDFHFLVGLLGSLNSSSNFNTTLTGNIYYSKKRLFAGVGFGQNTLLFTIGFVGNKTR